MNTASYIDLLDLLQRHEEAIADIYAVFSHQIPSMKTFWAKLANEEISHAMVITMIRKAIGNDNLSLDTRKFNVTAVQTAIAFISRQTEQIRTQGTTPIKALALATDLEKAMIEREFFSVFESDSPVMKKEFIELHEHTIQHQNMLQSMLDKEKSRAA
jgi:hypothetical protein